MEIDELAQLCARLVQYMRARRGEGEYNGTLCLTCEMQMKQKLRDALTEMLKGDRKQMRKIGFEV